MQRRRSGSGVAAISKLGQPQLFRAGAVGVDRFALLGQSQGCAISMTYAVCHPERATKLALIGGLARGGYWHLPEERDIARQRER